MFVRIVKSAFLVAAVYYGTRKAAAHVKLLQVRADAKSEIDLLEGQLRTMYAEKDNFDLSTREKSDQFNAALKQLSKWTRIYDKTF